jgi:DNA replication and repair protein RecF
MLIKKLSINNLRIIEQASVQLSPKLNIVSGANGSGKSSFLEAINILSMGRSFRSPQIKSVIKEQTDNLVVFAELLSDDRLAIQRDTKGGFQIKINHEKVNTLSSLSRYLPVCAITPESYLLLSAGPAARRQYIDFSVFHVEHQYSKIHQQYNKIIKQRNSLLKQCESYQELKVWDKQLAELGEQITLARKAEFKALKSHIKAIQSTFLPQYRVQYTLVDGWQSESSEGLLEQLQASYTQDKRYGYSHVGPHKSDIKVTINGQSAQEVLSRGELKMLIIAMLLAQVTRLATDNNNPSILLLDDLSSELDESKIIRLLDYLQQVPNLQMILTVISYQEIAQLLSNYLDEQSALFHVEHGVIKQSNTN